jgi:hypothetical protein
MDEPFHKELHEILMRKGWEYQRIDRYRELSYDYYYDKFNEREIIFYEDESINSFEKEKQMRIQDFDKITDGIFSENI